MGQIYDDKRLKELVADCKSLSQVEAKINKVIKTNLYFKKRINGLRNPVAAIKRALRDRGLLKNLVKDTKSVTAESLTKEKWLGFFSCSRTINEAVDKFNVSAAQVKKRLSKPIDGQRLYKHNGTFGQELFVYLPANKDQTKIKPRIWSYVMEKTGKPGVAINFPDDVGWRKREKNKNRKEKIRIVPISDVWLQYPNPHHLHDEANFNERLNWIEREDHVFAILNGDILYPRDYGPTKTRGQNFAKVVNSLRAKLTPIAHKILWAQAGCFEERHSKTAGLFDPIKHLCGEWNIPYFETPCSNVICWKGNLFSFYCIHGRSAAQKHGAKLNAAVRPLVFNEFTHFFVMSHIRDKKTRKVRRVRRNIEATGLSLEKQYAVICPSFVKYDESREAKWGYIPPSRGQMNLVVYADGDYHVYTSPQQEFEEIGI
ncbi:hypothetical protein KKB69_01385 [Patescibacteria group bacterium]|nr:hypothetical protein [Patescibacteria group bacterium]